MFVVIFTDFKINLFFKNLTYADSVLCSYPHHFPFQLPQTLLIDLPSSFMSSPSSCKISHCIQLVIPTCVRMDVKPSIGAWAAC